MDKEEVHKYCIMEYDLAIKKNEILSSAATWMDQAFFKGLPPIKSALPR